MDFLVDLYEHTEHSHVVYYKVVPLSETGGTREVYGRSEFETSRSANPLFIGSESPLREVWR